MEMMTVNSREVYLVDLMDLNLAVQRVHHSAVCWEPSMASQKETCLADPKD